MSAILKHYIQTSKALILKYHLLLPIFLILLVYRKLFHSHFINVDDPVILSSLQNMSVGDMFFAKGDTTWYRPITDISYIIDYYLWGKDPFGFHLMGILLHIVNTVLAYYLVLTLFKEKKNKRVIALLSSVLFAIHSTHLENLAWVSARADILSTAFLISSLICFILYYNAPYSISGYCYILLSGFAYLMGLFSKETAFVFLPVLIIYTIYFKPLSAKNPGKDIIRFRYPVRIVSLSIFVLFTFAYFIFKGYAVKGSDASNAILSVYYRHTVLPFFEADDIVTAFFHMLIPVTNFLGALGFYIKKLFLPFPTSFIILSIKEEVYVSLGVVAILLFIAMCKKRKRNMLLFLCLTSFFWLIPAFPVAFSQIAWTHYSERYLYMPSLFFSIAVSSWIGSFIFSSIIKRDIAILSFFLIVFFFSGLLYVKSDRWHNSRSLASSIIDMNPDKNIGYFLRGMHYYNQFDMKMATLDFKRAIELGGRGAVYYYMGQIEKRNGNIDKGLDLFKKSLHTVKNRYDFFQSVGDIYMEKGTEIPINNDYIIKSIGYYKKANQLNSSPSTLYRLAMSYSIAGDYINALNTANRLKNDYNSSVWANNVDKYTRQGFVKNAY